jgi:ribosomal protein L11 methyltransferase
MSASGARVTVAQLATDLATARRIADLLDEALEPADTAVATVDRQDGTWSLEVCFRTPPEEAEIRRLVALAAGADAGDALTFGALADIDWVAASLAGLSPVEAGRFLVHGAHHRCHATVNRFSIEIEAALAFGTGHHGSTRGCLMALDWLRKSHCPGRVLDIGTGTGVLAIAAAKAFRRPVMASDIDPSAAVIAHANAGLNGVRSLVHVVHAAGLASPSLRGTAYDLILANILLEPLRRLAAPVFPLAAPGAWIVLSGLLPGHANAALALWRAWGFSMCRRISVDGWTTLILRRRHRGRQ